MAVKVTLMLPEKLVEYAKRFGQATQRDVDQVLVDALEMMWSTVNTLSDLGSPVSLLSDEEVLALAVTVRRNWILAGWHPPKT